MNRKLSDYILNSDIGLIISVYNGNNFVNVKILELMVGYKVGTFVLTKKLGSFIHISKKKKKNKKKKE